MTVKYLPPRKSELVTDVSQYCPHCKESHGLLHGDGDGYHYCSGCRGQLDKCEPHKNEEAVSPGGIIIPSENQLKRFDQ